VVTEALRESLLSYLICVSTAFVTAIGEIHSFGTMRSMNGTYVAMYANLLIQAGMSSPQIVFFFVLFQLIKLVKNLFFDLI
jgi:hypothetical protein